MKTKLQMTVENSAPLGQKSPYPKSYDKSLLHPVRRAQQREAMALPAIQWRGVDIWNAYELAWLGLSGIPVRASASFFVPADSPFLAESKSVKLYLNSLNQERFAESSDVAELIARDLSAVCEAPVRVEIDPSSLAHLERNLKEFQCLDHLDVAITQYNRNPELLSVGVESKAEKLVSHVFKSHCLVTGQPDWGSIFVSYHGLALNHADLLRYLVSYHNHAGFSENCIEQIYTDLLTITKPSHLEVFGRFTRRGGIDINPYRANVEITAANSRLLFQ